MSAAIDHPEVIPDIADLRRRLAAALKIREEDLSSRCAPSQPLYLKLQIAAYALSKTEALPRPGIAAMLGKRESWVNYASAAIELRAKNQLFDEYVSKVIDALTL